MPFGIPYNLKGDDNVLFAGEILDESGLYYVFARYMDPSLGRWLSLDPQLGSLSMPQSMNRYVYCVNNPLRFVDPTGEGFWDSAKKWWDKHGTTVIQIAIIVVAVAATVATAGIASPVLAMAVGAAIGATSSFVSTYAATGDVMTSLKSAAIGGIAGAVGGGIGAKLAQAGIGAGVAGKIGSKLTGKSTLSLTKGEKLFGTWMARVESDIALDAAWSPYSGQAAKAFG